jgi:hypothetical protein
VARVLSVLLYSGPDRSQSLSESLGGMITDLRNEGDALKAGTKGRHLVVLEVINQKFSQSE